MAKQRSRKQAGTAPNTMPHFILKRLSEGSFILILTAALFVLLSLLTYQSTDPGWTHAQQAGNTILNSGGKVGAYLSDALFFAFGYFAFILPICVVIVAWSILRDLRSLQTIETPVIVLRAVGFALMIAGGCGLFSIDSQINQINAYHGAGGLIGKIVGEGWVQMLSVHGATLLLFAMVLVGITWLTGLSWINAIEMIGYYALVVYQGIRSVIAKVMAYIDNGTSFKQPSEPKQLIVEPKEKPISKIFRIKKEKEPEKERPTPVLLPVEPKVEVVKPEPIKAVKEPKEWRAPKPTTDGSLPSLNLLDKGQPGIPMGGYTHQELEHVSREVEQHLLDFGIQADVVAVHPGPVVTRFELQLAAGIKVSKLTALSKDLARSLSVISVRVVEVIPGKTVVGIELPNQTRQVVRLSDVLSADVYQQALSPLSLALGVDIAGHPMVVDLAKMPHLLVAGTTGSGKSVGINAMILSILFKATPEQVRLIMVDPKCWSCPFMMESLIY